MTPQSNQALKDGCSLFYKHMGNKLETVTCTSSQVEFAQLASRIRKENWKNNVVLTLGGFSLLTLGLQVIIAALVLVSDVVAKKYFNFHLVQNSMELFFNCLMIGITVSFSFFIFMVIIPTKANNGIATPLLIWALQDMGCEKASLESGIIVRNIKNLGKKWPVSINTSEFADVDFSKLEITEPLELLNDMCENYILIDGHAILLVNANKLERHNQSKISLEQIKNVRKEKTSVRAEEMIRTYGVLDSINVLDLKPISVDDLGKLYRVNSRNEGAWSLAFVCVKDPSVSADENFSEIEAKTHWLSVPPYMISAREAVAWTFGKKAQDYKPIVEV